MPGPSYCGPYDFECQTQNSKDAQLYNYAQCMNVVVYLVVS